ncbi:hypothetical protein KPHES18084_14790 [Corynebacterium ulcerans]|nr:hypothetical protein CULTSU28_15850 [Corynebacterium ulcerans]STC83824.1 Uncharacterised protein [Corynebacterium ulcerans]
MNCSPLVGLRNQKPTDGEQFNESAKFSNRLLVRRDPVGKLHRR